MTTVNDTPEALPDETLEEGGLTQEEIAIWRKEQELKRQIVFLKGKQESLLKEWQATRRTDAQLEAMTPEERDVQGENESKAVKRFNSIGLQIGLVDEQLRNLH